MKDNPQVAIMMPVFNGEKTLPLAIKSIQAQTYQNWKCYIVNDGSTDNTKEILNSLEDERFVVHHFKENRGRPYARQKALDLAEGRYIAFLDADDFFHPEKLEKQVNILEENIEIDLVSCGNLCYGKGFNPISYRGVGTNIVEFYDDKKGPTMALRTSLLRLDLCKKIIFNLSLKHAQDTDFLQKYLPNKKYIIQDEILYYYSEFDSVNKIKILKTEYYVLLQYKSSFSEKPLYSIVNMVKIMIRILLKLVLYPFVTADFYLKRRGISPLDSQKIEFTNVVKLLKN